MNVYLCDYVWNGERNSLKKLKNDNIYVYIFILIQRERERREGKSDINNHSQSFILWEY